MRILTFTSLFPNTLQPWHGIFVYQRVSHIAARPGNQVHVVAPVPYFPGWLPVGGWQSLGKIPREERVGNLDVTHPRYPLLPKVSMPIHGLLMFAGSLQIARQLHHEKVFDYIDAHYLYPDGFAAVLLGKRLRIPVVVSARGTDINLFPSFRFIRPMICWTLKQAAGVIAVSEGLKAATIGLGASATRACAIGNGVDLTRFEPVDQAEARQRLNMPRDAEIIVSVGHLVPVKGYQFTIAALAQIVPLHPKVRLYIIGDGKFRPELEALARKNQVEDRVFFVGPKPNGELKDWYSAANASCLASEREGWANVLLESLACGTPPVATRVCGTPEVIISPDLGVLVEPNSQSIAKGLELALVRRWDRDALVRYARTRTWDVVAEEVQNFVTSLIISSRSTPSSAAWDSDTAPPQNK